MKRKGKLVLLVIILLTFIFLFTRFYNLKKSPVWEDNFSWLYRINHYSWILELNFKRLNEKDRDMEYLGKISYHPGVTLMTFSGLSTRYGKKIFKMINPDYVSCGYFEGCEYLNEELLLAKIPLILIDSVAFFALLILMSRRHNVLPAVLFGLIILFEPLFYNNSRDLHLDFLQSILVTLSYVLFTQKNLSRNNIISGSVFGLALLTRFASIAFLSSFLVTNKIKIKTLLKKFALFMLTSIFVFFLLYPAMWFHPIKTVKYIYEGSIQSSSDSISSKREGNLNYFRGLGEYFNKSQSGMSTTWKFLFITSIIIFIYKIFKREHSELLQIFCFFGLYFLFLNLSDKRYLRYLTPVYSGFSLFIALAWSEIIEKLIPKIRKFLVLSNSKIHSTKINND